MPVQRKVAVRTLQLGMTHAETAQELECSLSTVGVHASRAKRKLRVALASLTTVITCCVSLLRFGSRRTTPAAGGTPPIRFPADLGLTEIIVLVCLACTAWIGLAATGMFGQSNKDVARSLLKLGREGIRIKGEQIAMGVRSISAALRLPADSTDHRPATGNPNRETSSNLELPRNPRG